jgi:hypothetical protein
LIFCHLSAPYLDITVKINDSSTCLDHGDYVKVQQKQRIGFFWEVGRADAVSIAQRTDAIGGI